MSGNENENVTQGNGNGNGNGSGNGSGNGAAGWGWEPVAQGGEYDSDATAFVKLPQDMLDALGTGEPLAAPGHGYVPPPMIVPLGSASTDPTATGAWTMPVRWPEAPGSAPAPAASAPLPGPAPVGGPIPASIPLPASVAAAFAEAEPEQARTHGQTQAHGQVPVASVDPGATAEWRFPQVEQEPEAVAGDAGPGIGSGSATGQWALPDLPEQQGDFRPGGLDADWSQAPATLPGGAPAPWAYLTRQPEPGTGLLPGTDEAVEASAAAARLLGGPGVGAQRRGPRVLGGPGVGTPLPEGEPVHPAPHDIEAAHGPAEEPAEDVRATEHAESPESPESPEFAQPGGTGGHGFSAFGHAPGPAREFVPGPEPAARPEAEPAPDAETSGEAALEPAPESVDAGGSGPAEAGPGPADDAAAPAPDADTADSAVRTPDADTAEGFPAEVATYEEEAAVPAEPVAHHEHPQASYVLRVNGADRPVTGAWIGESLLYVLRERLGLAGAKDGCSQGECGACAVQVDGRLVASCLVPAATAAGSEVRTVEGLATDGELSDVQQALCRSGAVQCGFCVPGMAMTIHDLLEGNHAPSELETRQALCGNLCRCSGYTGVIDAVREVVAEREAAAAEPTASPEPRIPHQAAPGEGGIHHGGTA